MAHVERVELIFVNAPETSATARLSGADLHVESGRRQISLAACIDKHTFDLKEVGAVPGLEREYLEEQQYISGGAAADVNDGRSERRSQSGISVDDSGARRILDVARTDGRVEHEEPEQDNDAVFEPTLAAGAPSEDSASTILDEDESSDAIVPEEDLSTEIEKAVHQSMVRSIRNTAVLSTQSKRLTMQSVNRIRNSLFNTDAFSDIDGIDASELINFDQP